MWKRFKTIFLIFKAEKGITPFFLGVILSVGFSLSVIISTIGLMDGFEKTLLNALRSSNGDISFYSDHGHISLDQNLKKNLTQIKNYDFLPIIKIEAFAINQNRGQGVLVMAFDYQQYQQKKERSFFEMIKINEKPKEHDVFIGEVLARELNLNPGDEFNLLIKSMDMGVTNSPLILSVKVKQLVKHGIYQKDARIMYLSSQYLQSNMNLLPSFFNNVLLKKNKNIISKDEIEKDFVSFTKTFPSIYHLRPFWLEFENLLNAVKVEKLSIIFILQIIVIVSLFNIFTFIIFLSEKKISEIFLMQALGLAISHLRHFWILMTLIIWILSNLMAIIFSYVFDRFILDLSFLKLPSEIYVINDLRLAWDLSNFLIVSFLSLIWIMLLSFFVFRLLKKQKIRSTLLGEWG
jgi:lipoprotein-releasing system permease protein